MNADAPDARPNVLAHGRQFSLSRLFRMHVGVAGMAAVVAYLIRREPVWPGHEVVPAEFLLHCSLLPAMAYFVTRIWFHFGRAASRIIAVLVAACAGAAFRGPMSREGDLMLLGAAVAVSWLVALGWLDSDRARAAPAPGASAEEGS